MGGGGRCLRENLFYGKVSEIYPSLYIVDAIDSMYFEAPIIGFIQTLEILRLVN